ncbi:MAG: hypothetical protein ACPGJS_16985 [Flammeovirgaceae bacterium]
MKLLDNWLTNGLIDFEYKQYILLAYLKHVRKAFEQRKLYPTFSDLIFHYKNLILVRDGKQLLYQNFPKEISRADFEKLELSYKQIVDDDEVMQTLTDIIFFAIPKFEGLLENGKELYELLASQIELEPIGISPLVPDQGYVFMNPYKQKETLIYQFQSTIFESAEERYRGISMTFIESIRKGIGTTYENIKLSLIRKYKLANPAAFLLVAKVPCPLEEAFLPISKRKLMEHIAHLS